MKHSNAAALGGRLRRGSGAQGCRRCVRMRREQCDRGCAFVDKNGNAVPHFLVSPLETKHVDVPLRGTFHIGHAHCDVINSLQVHTRNTECTKFTELKPVKERHDRRGTTVNSVDSVCSCSDSVEMKLCPDADVDMSM